MESYIQGRGNVQQIQSAFTNLTRDGRELITLENMMAGTLGVVHVFQTVFLDFD